MKKSFKIAALIGFFVIIICISLINHYGPTLGTQLVGKPIYIFPPSPERYGKLAIEIIDENGYYAYDERWQEQKEKALREIKNISSYEEAHSIIAESVKVGGGKHSLFYADKENYDSIQQVMPVVERKGDILSIKLPGIADGEKYGKEYAEIVLKGLKENSDVKGVMIDLRSNNGGNMVPMIIAISPLLPDGDILYFTDRNGDIPVILKDGQVSIGGTLLGTKPSIEPFKMEVPVAVLISTMTASSGEATLMTLMGLENVKTFGQQTIGLASGNAVYNLYDDAWMALTVTYNKTINGQIFGNTPIPADVKTTYIGYNSFVKCLDNSSIL